MPTSRRDGARRPCLDPHQESRTLVHAGPRERVDHTSQPFVYSSLSHVVTLNFPLERIALLKRLTESKLDMPNDNPLFDIGPLRESDRERWHILARSYKTFYGIDVPDSLYGDTWRRILRRDTVHGFAARQDGRVIGVAQYLFHAHLWIERTCYLQDLFVEEPRAPARRRTGLDRTRRGSRGKTRRREPLLADSSRQRCGESALRKTSH